ncbi:MAG: hypothetical protein HOO99_05015 [Hyphomicrobiaceae bacterium]|nr:hypothetical protein [Hyphomicrobiaceae bacterium]
MTDTTDKAPIELTFPEANPPSDPTQERDPSMPPPLPSDERAEYEALLKFFTENGSADTNLTALTSDEFIQTITT